LPATGAQRKQSVTVGKKLTDVLQPMNVIQPAKYCPNCGAPTEECCCGYNQTTTICITLNTGVLQSLVNLLPKIQVTTNRCSECGHQPHSGECPAPGCDCDSQ